MPYHPKKTYPIPVQLHVAPLHEDQQFGEFGRPSHRCPVFADSAIGALCRHVQAKVAAAAAVDWRQNCHLLVTVVIPVVRQIVGWQHCRRPEQRFRLPPVAIDGRFREGVREIAVLLVGHFQDCGVRIWKLVRLNLQLSLFQLMETFFKLS